MRTNENAEIRHNKIIDLLSVKHVLTVSELCLALDCSEATIRNDLRKLEEQEVLKRVTGGAVANDHLSRNTDIGKRLNIQNTEKTQIARYVVEKIIKPGMVITLDSGTTNMVLAQELLANKVPCTVITNSFLVANILAKSEFINFYLSGGFFDVKHASFHDEISLGLFDSLYSEICFISPNGIDKNGNVTNSGITENEIKRKMIQQAKKTIVLADYTKLGNSEIKIICSAKDVEMVITDSKVDVDLVKELRDVGFNIIKAKNK